MKYTTKSRLRPCHNLSSPVTMTKGGVACKRHAERPGAGRYGFGGL